MDMTVLPETEGYDKGRKHGERPGRIEKVREKLSTEVTQTRGISFNVQIAHLVVIIHAS